MEKFVLLLEKYTRFPSEIQGLYGKAGGEIRVELQYILDNEGKRKRLEDSMWYSRVDTNQPKGASSLMNRIGNTAASLRGETGMGLTTNSRLLKTLGVSEWRSPLIFIPKFAACTSGLVVLRSKARTVEKMLRHRAWGPKTPADAGKKRASGIHKRHGWLRRLLRLRFLPD